MTVQTIRTKSGKATSCSCLPAWWPVWLESAWKHLEQPVLISVLSLPCRFSWTGLVPGPDFCCCVLFGFKLLLNLIPAFGPDFSTWRLYVSTTAGLSIWFSLCLVWKNFQPAINCNKPYGPLLGMLVGFLNCIHLIWSFSFQFQFCDVTKGAFSTIYLHVFLSSLNDPVNLRKQNFFYLMASCCCCFFTVQFCPQTKLKVNIWCPCLFQLSVAYSIYIFTFILLFICLWIMFPKCFNSFCLERRDGPNNLGLKMPLIHKMGQ